MAEIERDAVAGLAARALAEVGVRCETVGVGSTPTCSAPPEHLEGVNEMHPGNYCMYDMMQATRGVCGVEDVALRVYTRVIGHYPRSNMLLVDMGWTGCSAQGAAHGYGEIEGHPELRIHVLKQEAGEIMLKPTPSEGGEGGGEGGEGGEGRTLDFARYPIGTVLKLMPWHACAASAMHAKMIAHRSGGRVVGTFDIARGW